MLKLSGFYCRTTLIGIYLPTLVLLFLVYSSYILGVPCLGFPIKTPLVGLPLGVLFPVSQGQNCLKEHYIQIILRPL